MSFPQTRHTLIQRLSTGGNERDWGQFLADYWSPVCRFARRGGAPSWQDAEDVAGQTFEALLRDRLLSRWVLQHSAKLRTLLCTIVRHLLSNRARIEKGRARVLREHGGQLDDRGGLPLLPALDASVEQLDAFYAAWVEEEVHSAVDALLVQCHRDGKGDHFRVLHSRLCDAMTLVEIAHAMSITVSQAENAFKQARRRLAEELERRVRAHVWRYCPEEEAESEFAAEWARLGEHLRTHGDLEAAVRRAFESVPPRSVERRSAVQKTLNRLSGLFDRSG